MAYGIKYLIDNTLCIFLIMYRPICGELNQSQLSKLSMESKKKKFFNKSFKAHQHKEGCGIKSQNYEVIWSQMFISSQFKLSMESKKFFNKSY